MKDKYMYMSGYGDEYKNSNVRFRAKKYPQKSIQTYSNQVSDQRRGFRQHTTHSPKCADVIGSDLYENGEERNCEESKNSQHDLRSYPLQPEPYFAQGSDQEYGHVVEDHPKR